MKERVRRADPATFEIVKNSLYKIAEEMRVVLAKTAYSPMLKSAGDYSCGVFDARGEMVAQGPDLPIHLGSMPDAVRAVVAAFAARRARRRRVHPQRSLFRRQPPARCECGAARLPRRAAARLRLPARPLARRRLCDAWQLRRGHGDLRRGPAPAAAAAVQPRRAQQSTSRSSSWPTCARPTSARATSAPSLRPPCARPNVSQGWRSATASETLIGYMAEVMDYSERLMRGSLVDLPDGEGALRGFLRRRRHSRRRRPARTRRSGSVCHVEKHGDRTGRGFRRHRSAGQRTDERAALGDGLGRLLRAQDRGRPEQPHSSQLGLLAHHSK